MRAIMGKGIRGAAVLLGVTVATACFGDPVTGADPIKPAVLAPPKEVPARLAPATGDGVYRMEIYEGPNRTVYYFGSGASSSEKATLSELQRAENEMDYLNKLQTLRRLYVNNELTLQPQRLYVQEQLYGTQISYGQTSLLAGYGYGGGYGMGGFNNYVNAYGPYTSSFNPYGGGFSGYLGGGSTQVVRSLAYGMGDEGVLKNNIAPVIAQQMASPEYAQKVLHDYQTALGEVAATPRLARGLRLDGHRPAEGAPVEFGRDRPPVTLTLKNGDRVEGSTMKDEGDFYVVDTPRGQTSVRKTEVVRIDKAKTEK
jgi:hypothetical protein